MTLFTKCLGCPEISSTSVGIEVLKGLMTETNIPGTVLKLSCDDGFVTGLSSSVVVECQGDGSWNSTIYDCEIS